MATKRLDSIVSSETKNKTSTDIAKNEDIAEKYYSHTK